MMRPEVVEIAEVDDAAADRVEVRRRADDHVARSVPNVLPGLQLGLD